MSFRHAPGALRGPLLLWLREAGEPEQQSPSSHRAYRGGLGNPGQPQTFSLPQGRDGWDGKGCGAQGDSPPRAGGIPGTRRFKPCPSGPGQPLKCESLAPAAKPLVLRRSHSLPCPIESPCNTANGPSKGHPQAVSVLGRVRIWEVPHLKTSQIATTPP